jgi:hypothetical protein
MPSLRFHLVLVSAMAMLLSTTAGEPKEWKSHARIGHILREEEVKAADAPQVRQAFFAQERTVEGLDALRGKHEATVDELKSLAAKLRLSSRERVLGVQANGRIGLVWWDVEKQTYRQSATKDAEYRVTADRLEAALAVLDGRALAEGQTVSGDTPAFPLPPDYIRSIAKATPGSEVGFGAGLGVGLAVGGPPDVAAGNFAPEPVEDNKARGALERFVAYRAESNLDKTFVVLVVYEYPDATSRVPKGYRFFAVASDEKVMKPINEAFAYATKK